MSFKNDTIRSLLAFDCNFHISFAVGVWLHYFYYNQFSPYKLAYFSHFQHNSKAISTLRFCFPWKSVPHKTIPWNSISSCKSTRTPCSQFGWWNFFPNPKYRNWTWAMYLKEFLGFYEFLLNIWGNYVPKLSIQTFNIRYSTRKMQLLHFYGQANAVANLGKKEKKNNNAGVAAVTVDAESFTSLQLQGGDASLLIY